MPMDKEKLKQYIPLKKELKMLDKKLEKLYARQENIPEVLGKVTGSIGSDILCKNTDGKRRCGCSRIRCK